MSILIVDDEKEILENLRRHFELEGIKVHIAGNGDEAIRIQREKLCPVVLTDIRMPGMSGSDLVLEIKKIHPTCIVFAMTGYGTLMGMVECLGNGAADYFFKPFEHTSEIVSQVKEALLRNQRWMKELKSLQIDKNQQNQ